MKSHLPYRVDAAGTWIDRPYVSQHGAGVGVDHFDRADGRVYGRGGMSTSTRNAARKVWPYEFLPTMRRCLHGCCSASKTIPQRTKGHVSGAQDAIGICMSGLTRHYYDGHYWPQRIESCHDEEVLCRGWKSHLCLVPMFPVGKDVRLCRGRI